MPDIDTEIARHYTSGALMTHILNALRTLDIDADAPTPDDLAAVDEFHSGGRRATDDLLAQVEIRPPARALDIGCGIGGPARHVAHTRGAHVTGVDLTRELVETARELSALVGLADQTDFHTGSALDLPVEDAHFDLALMLHVGMNIEDKIRLMAEAKRVLKPGGVFAVFDVMRGEDAAAPLRFPLPWAEGAETSFVTPLAAYEDAARAAGFEIVASRARTAFVLDFFADIAARKKAHGPSPLGVHLMMGETAGEKVGNLVREMKSGRLAPVELILRA